VFLSESRTGDGDGRPASVCESAVVTVAGGFDTWAGSGVAITGGAKVAPGSTREGERGGSVRIGPSLPRPGGDVGYEVAHGQVGSGE
jgi:hypothetical protein